MLHDIKFAFRLFARQRIFFATTVLTIAAGIGLTSTVFSIVDGVLFRPLPYRDPSRLVALYGAVRAEQQWTMPVSEPDLLDWRAASKSFQQIEAYDLGRPGARVRGVDELVQARCSAVTTNFLDMLGVKPIRGRAFAADDFRPDAPAVALISYRLWRGVFGGESDVLGRTIDIGTVRHVIVGILPRSFSFPNPTPRFTPEVLIPFDLSNRTNDRSARSLYAIGRLAYGVTIQQARTEMDGIALRLKPLFVGRPNTLPGAFDGATLEDLRNNITRAPRSVMGLVFAAVTAVFLIACVNVIGLLLALGEDRKRELGIRVAIGADRAALVRQLLVEAALLAIVGASAGWLLSAGLFRFVVNEIPQWLQLVGEPRIDMRVAGFAGILGLFTLVVAGVIPALRACALPPRIALAADTRQISTASRAKHALILLEVALATLLLCAGSIMLRSWMKLYAQETGMDADRLIVVRAVSVGIADGVGRARHNAILADAVRRVPGVTSLAFVDLPLLQKAIKGSGFIPPAQVPHPAGMDTDLIVTPGYFETMGMVLRMGRGLASSDRGHAVVINESLAKRYWPDRNPVGETIRYRDGSRQIAGVVSDSRDVSLDRPPVPTLYHVWDDTDPPLATLVVRFSGSAAPVMSEIRRAVRAADADAAITMLSTVEDLMSVSVAERNFNTLLFVAFGGAGLLVALVGIYGLVAFVVARREREMGIRLALGASGRGIKVLVMADTLRWVAAGLVVGTGAALAWGQYLKPFVYQMPPNDPLTLVFVAAAFLVIAATATYSPASRAARVDPMIALRSE